MKMVRRTIKNPKEFQRKTLQEATNIFLQHCRINNLSPRTLKYYEEDLNYFFSRIRVKYVDEITLEVYVKTIAIIPFRLFGDGFA